jgi:hypothetical protein
MSYMYSVEKFLYRRNKSIPVFREYDRRRGFSTWSNECQKSSSRAGRDPAKDILGTTGFAQLRVLSEARTNQIRHQFDQEGSELTGGKNSAISQTLKPTDSEALKAVVADLITPEVDNLLYNYFGSEYCAYWYHFSRALPNKEPKRSFLWHCDKGPTMHAKMLFYLTSVEETGGNTFLLDRDTTNKFDRAGYVFGGQKDRQDDLGEFAQRHRIDFAPFSFDMKPGEAILFLPQKVLHRGVLPTLSPRFIMQVTFLPAKANWRDLLMQKREASLDDLAKDYAWPSHAEELRSSLGG